MAEALAARRAAAGILDRVMTQCQPLSEILSDPAGPLVALAPDERARAQRLASAALRRIAPADSVLGVHMARKPAPAVLNLLRLAVTELSERPQDAHGIVNATVSLVRQSGRNASAAGFVNAVLRKLATGSDPLAGQAVQRLPDWLRKPLVAAWGKDAVAAIEVAHAAGAPLDLTLKDPADAPALAAELGAIALPAGSVRLTVQRQVSSLSGFDTGRWWVQDAAAALPARILAPEPGMRVLDICAAPGGKTLQLASAGARVTALDISGPRMARLRENLVRCGLQADLVVADALYWTPPDGPFDRVLLDAPCSATGTIRRHPDLPFVRTADDLPKLIALQAALIDRAVALARRGGRLVYCTCSLLPAEGEDQIAAALSRHPGLKIARIALEGVPAEWATMGGGLRLRPDYWSHLGGMDGFFMAELIVS